MVMGGLMGSLMSGLVDRRESAAVIGESGGVEVEIGRWVAEELGEGNMGSREVARCRFARRELRNAAECFSKLSLSMES
jgi:hypothetical protein